ncbi:MULTISPECIES: helix-turn-helix transcriptional regulator [unclassified Bradyrhizobium]|uniref:helix-turn-helix transcriptional regulator n=1 Tax=unclassified Bradyrhizobium TaxID=2631580 RepID=UPI00211E71D4|nr:MULTISPECIES: helix-turn-helix transcriptional regulator [unclassified Bradyrhizobium]MDD1537612.1 DNA-binding protein [Bradyrhizobium sp. WBOS8]MDD1587080.1 DNA-binding protein [Bradyrhizobium sp. WBOS4]UUO51470.1 DNA-binding protein [Bradyrhizobium sp. WBOS04]UUO63257.1 DNA-binding protein [Bradyrhizobium sp. WBOS08]
MRELLTTEEAAEFLRLSERKLYELVAKNAVPCTKVTGKWLFPRAALNRWLMAGMAPTQLAREAAPPIIGGSHDPLLEWSLRESGCGLASLPEGSEEGLRRLCCGEVMIAAMHLHALNEDGEQTNVARIADIQELSDAVLIAFARREQGLVVAPGNPLKLSDLASVAKSRARLAQRPRGAGAQLLMMTLLAREGVAIGELALQQPICATGDEIGHAVRSGKADCGIATRSVARAAGLDFAPLTWERFDLALRQHDYFLPQPQKLFEFFRSSSFKQRAEELGGYDLTPVGNVRLVN